MSPTATIEMQTANCFEMAILLVSFLIGCEYNAFVVYGYATEIVCNNDLRKVRIDIEEYVCIKVFITKLILTLILMVEGSRKVRFQKYFERFR